ncbi:conjugative transfer signal peptidase TraF [Devosia sp. UYZn731]|uniref:conjugative transfer signal peptidase TraF n=1 Tax=Devosia sp. UYZn731 TaxID=3156345 RepID=UPI003394F616
MTARHQTVIAMGAGGALIAILFAAGSWGGLRINFTPSYPLGLWRVTSLDRPISVGDLVLICPPETAAFILARERGYVRRGLCPGWLTPLIKTVAAIAGQQIKIGQSVRIDGYALEHSEIHAVDAEGRALSAFPGGTVPAAQVFLHSDFAGSYDSRYFGPIPTDGILGLAHPILTVPP